jgi:hypothetical protein
MHENNNKSTLDFKKYFTDSYEYPQPTLVLLLPGTVFYYISNTFLNGWINYVTLVRAWLVTRYLPHKENIKALAEHVEANQFHTNLNQFMHDDKHLLVRAAGDDPKRPWWWFWYDQDCSDCAIGVFETDDSDEEVCRKFDEMIDRLSEQVRESPDYGPKLEIPLKSIRGWIAG